MGKTGYLKITGKFFAVCMMAFGILAKKLEADALEPTPEPYGDITINLFVAAIDPTLTSIDGGTYQNGQTTIKASEYLGFSLDDSLSMWIKNFEEISHNRVKINVVDTVIIDEFPKYNSTNSLDNESFQRIFKKDDSGRGDWYSGIFDPDYAQYDNWGELNYKYYIDKLDLVNKKNAGEFDMLFLIGIDPLSPYETCMVGNHTFWINGEGIKADCDNFVILTPTFSRQDGSIENIGHMAERMLGYAYGSVEYMKNSLDGSDYSSLNDWQKYCLCKFIATPDTEVYGYGMVHFSPNSDSDYDWSNNKAVNYYTDWQNAEGIEKFTADNAYLKDSRFNYNNDPCISHHRWWFYNMPYEDGRDEDGYLKNWWRYIFTPDYVINLLPAETYKGSLISLEPGEEASLDFMVRYNSLKNITTDVVASEAALSLPDTDVFSYENGKITALKDGTADIVIKLDGKELTYSVNVETFVEEEVIEPAQEEIVEETSEVVETEPVTEKITETLNNEDFDYLPVVVAVAAAAFLAVVIIVIVKNKKK